jgi:2-oxoglutarate ferredoxin oxidoreductase subunit alpha
MMLDDVQKIVKGKVPVEFYGRLGGVTPLPDEILDEIRRVSKNEGEISGDPRDEWMDRLEKMRTGDQ